MRRPTSTSCASSSRVQSSIDSDGRLDGRTRIFFVGGIGVDGVTTTAMTNERSPPLETCGVKTIEPGHGGIGIGKVAGQRSQLALRGQPVGGDLRFARLDRPAAKVARPRKEIVHDLR